MCSLEDRVLLEEGNNTGSSNFGENILCKKCKELEPNVVLRANDKYCERCFLTSSTHKFRATLGKSHLIRPGSKVLIAYSGGQCSSALLHLVKSGLCETTHKKLRFEPMLLHIDESICSGETQSDSLPAIIDCMKSTNFQYFCAGLSQSLDKEFSISNNLMISNVSLDNELLSILAKLESSSAKQDLLLKLKYNLIAAIAVKLHCEFVFLGDICTNLASTLLSNIALGRGAHLSLDVAFLDTRFPNLKILRPLRDFVLTEISYYNLFNKIVPADPTTRKMSTNSIQTLTKLFIDELQENFPATVYTIFRTGEKLSTSLKHSKESTPCAICNAPLDTENQGLSALKSTRLSKEISCSGPLDDVTCTKKKFPEDQNVIAHMKTKVQKQNRENNLCYGCMLIKKDFNRDVELPESFKKLGL